MTTDYQALYEAACDEIATLQAELKEPKVKIYSNVSNVTITRNADGSYTIDPEFGMSA